MGLSGYVDRQRGEGQPAGEGGGQLEDVAVTLNPGYSHTLGPVTVSL